MLTIKHVECDGYESVHQASHVDYRPWDAEADKGAEVMAFGVPGEAFPLHFATGKVYVMGDGGKTVAAYSLDCRYRELPDRDPEQLLRG